MSLSVEETWTHQQNNFVTCVRSQTALATRGKYRSSCCSSSWDVVWWSWRRYLFLEFLIGNDANEQTSKMGSSHRRSWTSATSEVFPICCQPLKVVPHPAGSKKNQKPDTPQKNLKRKLHIVISFASPNTNHILTDAWCPERCWVSMCLPPIVFIMDPKE